MLQADANATRCASAVSPANIPTCRPRTRPAPQSFNIRVAIVTSQAYAELVEDEQQLVLALAKRGMNAVPAVWSDSEIDWASFDVALIRSTWDYHLRSDEFFAWIERIRSQTRVVNEPDLMRWNSDKRYLLELQKRGIPIVPTVFLERDSRYDVMSVVETFEAREFVMKPAVSANSFGLTIFAADHEPLEGAQAVLDDAISRGVVMVQPFLREVYDPAERSLVYFAGAFSHAVLRQVAKVDDLSLRPPTSPSKDERELAERALSLLPHVPLYARVDVIPRYSGEIVLSELELIEPSLFLMSDPESVERFADAIKGYLRPRSERDR